eukprot:TRINITY_DN1281_c0_g1_i1.p1 TRINITY_DN1281_c0_g1~~TRINITY_DN1281_c0_g1_i1.p1  ORF type:complete len:1564 (-),score=458.03 TRINITY_DN1281_c0_g1_i1:93-4784(-)
MASKDAASIGPSVSDSSSLDSLLEALSASERHLLLQKYAEVNPANQVLVDQLLHTIAINEPLSLFNNLRSEILLEGKNPDKKPAVVANFAAQNAKLLEEYKKFWTDGISTPPILKKSTSLSKGKPKRKSLMVSASLVFNVSPTRTRADSTVSDVSKQQEHVQKLASYVPKLVLRSLLKKYDPNNSTTVSVGAPEIETFHACVMFADISGFTPLTEKLASVGLEGIEKLTAVLNSYFDKLVATIHEHGGDVVKFAGDAVLCCWPCSTRAGISGMIMLACQCAKALLKNLNDYSVEGTGCVLRLHIGVGAGEVSGINVGGEKSQFEFFISGQVLEQVSSCEKEAAPGEVFVSAVAWMLVDKGRLIGHQKEKNAGALSNYRLDSIEYPADLPEEEKLVVHPSLEPALRSYLQQAVIRHHSLGVKEWLAELRVVSVIFVNLTTPFKDSKLNELQLAIVEMQSIIYKYEGTVRQFIIDDKGSVMVIGFGIPPYAHTDDPVRAVETALGIHSALQRLQMPCSIGVTTGKAFCGDVGSNLRREYAMVGDIVNLSARLMVAAKTDILCDIDTYEACKNAKNVDFKKLDDIKVKGKTNPIAIFQPRKVRGKFYAPLDASRETEKSSIVGRDLELGMIKEILKTRQKVPENERTSSKNSAKRGKNTTRSRFQLTVGTQVLILEGAEGVGKTRILQAASSLIRKSKYRVFYGSGEEITLSTQYAPFHDIFQSLLVSNGTDKELPAELQKELGEELLPLLNGVLGLELEETPKIKTFSAQMRSETTQTLLLRLLEKAAPPGSVFFLDNVQWFDSASWSLISVACSKLTCVLWALATRPFESSFQYSQIFHMARHIRLKNLTMDNIKTLIEQRLQVNRVPDEVVKEVYLKGQGNPFLSEEIIFALRDSGMIKAKGNGELVALNDFKRLAKAVPDSVAGLLTSKIDKLSPQHQQILKQASVIGQVFSVKMLVRLLTCSREELMEDLGQLEQAGIIVAESPEPFPHYAFANLLIKDVVYQLMLFAQRRSIHNNIAQLILKDYPGKSSYYGILAHHLKKAEQTDEAIDLFVKAGSHSLNSYANKEAVTFFTDALQLIEAAISSGARPSEPAQFSEIISTERKLGQAFYNLGEFDKAEEHFKSALVQMGTDVMKLKTSFSRKSLKFVAKDQGKGKLPVSEFSYRQREAILILLDMSKINYFTCNLGTASLCSSLALQIALESTSAFLAESYAFSGLVNSLSGNVQLSEICLSKAKEMEGREANQMNVHLYAGIACAGRGEWNRAFDSLKTASDFASIVGDLKVFEESQVFLANVLFLKGELDRSIEVLNNALESSAQRGDIQTQVFALTSLASCFFLAQDFSKCFKCIEDVDLILESVDVIHTSSKINHYALKTLFMLKSQHDLDECWGYANKTLGLIASAEICAFYNFHGYSFLVEAYVQMLRRLNHRGKNENHHSLTQGKISSKKSKAMELLKKFTAVFEFAAPLVDIWKSVWHGMTGKKASADKRWAKTLEMAKSNGTPYIQAVALYEKGMQGLNEEDLRKAKEIVPKIDRRSEKLIGFKWFGDSSNLRFESLSRSL